MGLSIIQVDAFTAMAFAGNPAAVCVLPQVADATWMQNIACEMNLSETAFLVRQADGFDLRWFTPATEVELCGHATLASAHVLWTENYLKADEQARFHTLSGLLTARRDGEWIEMDFPAQAESAIDVPSGLLEALDVPATYVGQNKFDYLVEVASEDTVREMRPDYLLLSDLPVRGVIVTSRAKSTEYDFVSRFFGPRVGVNEDPVTGSAHCCLGPYWAKKLGKKRLLGYQVSSRGGVVRVHVEGERVKLAGQAVTVMRGELV